MMKTETFLKSKNGTAVFVFTDTNLPVTLSYKQLGKPFYSILQHES